MSYSKLDVEGPAPFKESGIYEVQISIVGNKPTDDELKNKTFTSLWNANFHLRVKNGSFAETLGSSDNPIPDSVYTNEKIWVVVTDLLSSLNSIFEVSIERNLQSHRPFDMEHVNPK